MGHNAQNKNKDKKRKNSIQFSMLTWAVSKAFQHQPSSAFLRNKALCVCILNLAKVEMSANWGAMRGPTVSHRFSKTPAQPSFWNSHCPAKTTKQPAQACSYLSVHASARQPLLGCSQHTHRCTHTSTAVEHHDVVMSWTLSGWTLIVSAKKCAPFLYSTYNVSWVLLTYTVIQ